MDGILGLGPAVQGQKLLDVARRHGKNGGRSSFWAAAGTAMPLCWNLDPNRCWSQAKRAEAPAEWADSSIGCSGRAPVAGLPRSEGTSF